MPRQYDKSTAKTSTAILMDQLDLNIAQEESTRTAKEILSCFDSPQPLARIRLEPTPKSAAYFIVKIICALKTLKYALDKATSNHQRQFVLTTVKKIINSDEYKKIVSLNTSFSLTIEFIEALKQIVDSLPATYQTDMIKQEACARFNQCITSDLGDNIIASYEQHSKHKHLEYLDALRNHGASMRPEERNRLAEGYYRYNAQLIDEDILVTELEYLTNFMTTDSFVITTEEDRRRFANAFLEKIAELQQSLNRSQTLTIDSANFINGLLLATLKVAESLAPYLKQKNVDWFRQAKLYNPLKYNLDSGVIRSVHQVFRKHPFKSLTSAVFMITGIATVGTRLYSVMTDSESKDPYTEHHLDSHALLVLFSSFWLGVSHFMRSYPTPLQMEDIEERIPKNVPLALPEWVSEFKEQPLVTVKPSEPKKVEPVAQTIEQVPAQPITKPVIDWNAIDTQRKSVLKKAYQEYKKLLEETDSSASALFNTKNAAKKSAVNLIYSGLMENLDEYFEGTSILANTKKLHEDLLGEWNHLLSHGEKKIMAPVVVLDTVEEKKEALPVQQAPILKQKNPMPMKIRYETGDAEGSGSSSSTAKPLKPSQDPNEIHLKRIAKIHRDYPQDKQMPADPKNILAMKYDLLELCQRTIASLQLSDKDHAHHPVLVLRHGLVHHDLDIPDAPKHELYLGLLKDFNRIDNAMRTELMQGFDAQYTAWHTDKFSNKADKAELKNKRELNSGLQVNVIARLRSIKEYYHLYLESTSERETAELNRKAYLMSIIEVGEILQQLINAKQDLSQLMPFDVVLAFTEFRTTSCHLLDNPSHETLGKIMNMIENLDPLVSGSSRLACQ